MVYKKYVKRGNKRFGPYYYESYRGENGKVRTRYIFPSKTTKITKTKKIKKTKTSRKGIKGIFLILAVFCLLVVILAFVSIQTGLINKESFYEVSNIGSLYDKASSMYSSLYKNLAGLVVSEDDEGQEEAAETEEAEEAEEEEVEESEEETEEEAEVTEETEEEAEAAEEAAVEEEAEVPEIEVMVPPIPEMNITEENITEEIPVNETITNITISEENITEIDVTEENITEVNVTIPEEVAEGVTEIAEINITNVTEEISEDIIINETARIEMETKQYKAVIGRPVKWIKTIKKVGVRNLTLEVPKKAQNITIKTGAEVQEALGEIEKYGELIEQADREDIKQGILTGMVSLELREKQGFLTILWEWLINSGLTGKVIGDVIEEQEIEDEITETDDSKVIDLGDIPEVQEEEEIAVEYYTEAPTATESFFGNGKRIVISAPTELHYTDVLAYTELKNVVGINETNKIKLYFYNKTGETTIKQKIDFTAYDLDGDGFVDYIEWVVLHLSEQTYDVIYITRAEHLDENREVVSDIFDSVKRRDGIWSEVIPNEHYVRITFERNLTSEKHIKIYAKGGAEIEVYVENGDELIAKFENVQEEGWYKVYLTGMAEGESHDVFDLRILGRAEFDFIIDPTISACGVLSTQGASYEMIDGGITNNDLTGPCLNVTASDVTILCLGLSNSISSDDNVAGIYSDQLNTEIVECNITMGSGGTGIHLAGANNSEIYETLLANQGTGVWLDGAHNSLIYNNSIDSNSNGVVLLTSSDNTFANNTMSSNTANGVHLRDRSGNNTIYGCSILSNAVGIKIGDEEESSDNNITDSNISLSTTSDIVLASVIGNSKNNIFLNASYSGEEDLGVGEIIRKWYYRAYVNNTNGNVVEEVNVTAFNKTADYIFNLTSGADGYTQRGHIIDYVSLAGTKTHYSNYTIYAEKTGSTTVNHTYNATLNENNLKDVFTLSDTGAPTITIKSPKAANYPTSSIDFNVSADENLSSCNFTLDSWVTNYTMTRFNDTYFNYTNTTIGDGTYTAVFACNDTANNLGTANVTFIVDTTYPLVSFAVNTLNNSAREWQSNVYVNVSVTDTNNISVFIDFDNSLVSWWRMDDVSGTTVIDYMNRNNGTLQNDAHQTDAGYFGKGFEFDGDGDYIDTENDASLDFLETSSYTYSAWIKKSESRSQVILSKGKCGGAGARYGFRFYLNETDNLIFESCSLGDTSASASTIGTDWNHVVAVFSEGNTTLYLNGVEENSEVLSLDGTGDATSGNFIIGKLPIGLQEYFNGTLDDVMIFNRSLSAEEIRGLYANTSSKYVTHNFTNLDYGSPTFKAYTQDVAGNVNTTEERKITLIGSEWNVSLSYGWNLISFSFNETDTGKDKNVTINTGWNLIGYSSSTALDLNSSKFTNSSGSLFTWSSAISNSKLQPYLVYFDYPSATVAGRKYKYTATSDINLDDTSLRQNYGYWLYSNESGNLTFPGVGGTLSNATFDWNNLVFHNTTDEKNVSVAASDDWIFSTGAAAKINYWDPSENGWDTVCGTILCDKTTFSSWEGYFIWSNSGNVTLIRYN